MGKKYNGGIPTPTSISVNKAEPSNDREIVENLSDLLTLEYAYPLMKVVVEEDGNTYQWVGGAQNDLSNWVDEVTVLKNGLSAITKGEGLVFETRAQAIAAPITPDELDPFTVYNESGFNGQYAFTSGNVDGYILISLFVNQAEVGDSMEGSSKYFDGDKTIDRIREELFDSEPTDGSTKAVESDGVKVAIDSLKSLMFKDLKVNTEIANVTGTYYSDLSHTTDDDISIFIKSDNDNETFYFNQRDNSNNNLDTTEVLTNTLVTTKIYNSDVTKFFIINSNAPIGSYEIFVFKDSEISNIHTSLLNTNTNEINSQKSELNALDSDVQELQSDVQELQVSVIDEKINTRDSITVDSSGNLIGSFSFSKTGLGDKVISVLITSVNTETIQVRQRYGNVNKSDYVSINTNEIAYMTVVDDTVDKLYAFNNNGDISEGEYFFEINLLSEINQEIYNLSNNIDLQDLENEVQIIEGKVNQNEQAILNLSSLSSGVPLTLQRDEYVFGKSFNTDNIIGSQLQLEIFSNVTKSLPLGNNKLWLNDESQVFNGSNYSVTNNIITISNTANSQVVEIVKYFTLPAGTYTFFADVQGNMSNTSLNFRLNGVGILDGENIDITRNGAVTHTSTEKGIFRLYLYQSASTILTGDITAKIMVNEGSSALSWEAPNENLDLEFGIDNDLTLSVGDNDTILSKPNAYGLAAIPVTVTATTEKESDVATYSDAKGNSYISDSFEYENGLLKYIKRVGLSTYSTGDAIPSDYLSTHSSGELVDGFDYYFPLNTQTTTTLTPSVHQIGVNDIVTTDKTNAYIYGKFNVAKDLKDNSASLLRMGMIPIDKTKYWRSALKIEGDYMYVGADYGYLEKIDISNENKMVSIATQNLDTENAIRQIVINGDYLYVIQRDPTAATPTSTTNIGNLYTLNKNTLAVLDSQILYNKGTGGAMYKGYLYVMEQMWDFQVFDVTTDPTTPQLVYTYDGDWRYGEFQNLVFWEADGKDYFMSTSFDKGINIIDISDPTNPIKVGGSECKFGVDGDGSMQIFDVAIKYPYVYATISPKTSSLKYARECYRGIVKIDVSDVTKFETTGGEILSQMPLGTFEISQIPFLDWSPHLSEGDLQPSRIKRLGNVLIVNNGEKGIALFKINEDNYPIYQGSFSFGSQTHALDVDKDGRLGIAASHKGGDNNQYAYLYRLLNVNFEN